MRRRSVAALIATVPLALAPVLGAGAAQAAPAGASERSHQAKERPKDGPKHRPDKRGPVGHRLPHTATMTGTGGAVASVDPVASQVGIEVLRKGGTAAEAAVATTAENAERFAMFPDTAKVFLPGGEPVKAGDVLKQPDLARTLGLLRKDGIDAMYRGPIGEAVVKTVNEPATAPGVTVPAGGMTMKDLGAYEALAKKPVVSEYKGVTVYGMPSPSSGGIAVAEILNLLEQFGGSGMVVPGYGFLLNNENTDFNMLPAMEGEPDPNLPAPDKRPRSSMAPTIVLKDGRPILATGAAGGPTIITSVAQIVTGYLDRDLTLVGAVGAARISSRNTGAGAQAQIIDTATGAALRELGQPMEPVEALGRATAIAMPGKGWFVPAAEPNRGGGGSAMVVKQRW